jgi:hypothetical protein
MTITSRNIMPSKLKRRSAKHTKVRQCKKRASVGSPQKYKTRMIPRAARLENQRIEVSPKTPDYVFFQPYEWSVFHKAHNMVEELVFENGPYRNKLIELTNLSKAEYIQNYPGSGLPTEDKGEALVTKAWNSVKYAWCSKSNNVVSKENDCAFTGMGQQGARAFPVIIISEIFRDNASSVMQRGSDRVSDSNYNRALLFFFRQIKHGFLNVAHTYLEIKLEHTTTVKSTPEKFSTNSKNWPRYGDHDQEEDSGGPVLPFDPTKKLSEENPLCCLYWQEKKLILDDDQVEALLDLKLYKYHTSTDGVKHEGGNWYFGLCRAAQFNSHLFSEEYYRQAGMKCRVVSIYAYETRSRNEHSREPNASKKRKIDQEKANSEPLEDDDHLRYYSTEFRYDPCAAA